MYKKYSSNFINNMVRALVIFVVAFTLSSAIESNFYREEACAEQGGYCLLRSECPNKNIDKECEGLCASQRSAGAICCKNYTGDLNCFQTHNSCFKEDKCPRALNLGTKGCEKGETCCVLV